MKIKNFLKESGLNYKLELIIMLFVNISFLALLVYFFFFLSNYVYIGIILIFIVLFNVLNCFRIYLNKKQIEEKDIIDLLITFKILSIEINQNKNIIDALIASKEHSSMKICGLLDDLIANIKANKSVDCYLSFAHQFKSVKVEELMISLHSLSIDNTKENINEFNLNYEKLLEENEKDDKKRIDTNFSLIKSFPLLALIVVVFITIISVALIIGKDINV